MKQLRSRVVCAHAVCWAAVMPVVISSASSQDTPAIGIETAATGSSAAASVPSVGDTRERVISLLGSPKGRFAVGKNEILIYDRGEITIEGGKVTRVQLMSDETVMKKTAAASAARATPARSFQPAAAQSANGQTSQQKPDGQEAIGFRKQSDEVRRSNVSMRTAEEQYRAASQEGKAWEAQQQVKRLTEKPQDRWEKREQLREKFRIAAQELADLRAGQRPLLSPETKSYGVGEVIYTYHVLSEPAAKARIRKLEEECQQLLKEIDSL